jgi:hypothetical protein
MPVIIPGPAPLSLRSSPASSPGAELLSTLQESANGHWFRDWLKEGMQLGTEGYFAASQPYSSGARAPDEALLETPDSEAPLTEGAPIPRLPLLLGKLLPLLKDAAYPFTVIHSCWKQGLASVVCDAEIRGS